MKTRNLLVPIGSAKNAASNLQYAIDLATAITAKVYVVSVFKEFSKVGNFSKVNALMKEDAETQLAQVLAAVDKKGVQVIAHPIKGEMLESINRVNRQLNIDLMVLSPRSNSIKEEVYLGKTSGKLLKQTNIPILVVPEGATFSPPKSMLMAFKNGTFESDSLLDAVQIFIQNFQTEVHVLHVETPETTEEMKSLSPNIEALKSSYTKAENATTFQALLEHFQHFQPDMLCVVRRKRGFFQKLMEKNEIMKRDFHSSRPLLVLPVQKTKNRQ